jgi:sugar/nucleoside kinase (ribokinase family)
MTRGVASIGGISIDTVLGADGDYAEGLLGGNAIYGAWGASLWLDDGEAHLIGLVGGDFPRDWVDAMAGAGISLDGLEVVENLATSVWRKAYVDGAQRVDLNGPCGPAGQVLVTGPLAASSRAAGQPGVLEPRLHGGDQIVAGLGAAHCAPVQPSTLLHNLGRLREHAVTILVDPGEESSVWTAGMTAEVLAQSDVYCPSLDDLAEPSRKDPLGTAARLCHLGPETVVVKLGPMGSLVYSDGRGTFIPAAPASVVDPTGAGDTYCGAFAAVLLRFGDPFVAGVLASATASIAVEHHGLIDCLGRGRAALRERAHWVAARLGLSLPVLTDP